MSVNLYFGVAVSVLRDLDHLVRLQIFYSLLKIFKFKIWAGSIEFLEIDSYLGKTKATSHWDLLLKQ